MKHYKLQAWPDLPAAFHRTAYRRMLHKMSQRYASVQQLMSESGLARTAVVQFLDMLAERKLLTVRDDGVPDSRFGPTSAFQWVRRTFYAEGHL